MNTLVNLNDNVNLNNNINVNLNNNINVNKKEKNNPKPIAQSEFAKSLKNKYPKIKIDCDIDQTKHDTKLLLNAIQQSPDFLQSLALSVILAHYSEVIAGKYKKLERDKQDRSELQYMTHKYSPEELNNRFDDLGDVEV